MLRLSRCYDVHGMSLNVEAESQLLLNCVGDTLGPFACTESGERPFHFQLSYYETSPLRYIPLGLRKFWGGTVPGGIYIEYYTGEGVRHVELPGLAQLRIDLRGRKAFGLVKAREEWCAGYGCVIPAVAEFLTLTGQYMIHTGSLVLEGDSSRRAVMLAGESGSGKSTTSLALSRGSMELMSDDASVIMKDASAKKIALWGLPRACKVHERTLKLLPWLGDYPRQPAFTEDEYVIDFKDVSVLTDAPTAEPRVILLLEKRNPAEHSIKPLDRITTLARLTRENVRALEVRSDGPAGEAFRALGQLVRQCDTYALSVGPRIETLGPLIEALLRKKRE